MNQDPEKLLRLWMQYVNEGNTEGLIAMYSENAILLPTFSNRLLNTPEGIRDYFERLGKREGLHLSLHERTLNIQLVRDGIYSLCGLYCWRFMIDGEHLSFEARFTYVMDTAAERPVIHHHSSQIPRML